MNKASLLNREFYRGKRVFLTGHTGFKGAWLTAALHVLGAETAGYALPAAHGSLFEKIGGEALLSHHIGDVRDKQALHDAIGMFQPEIVIHLAAMATVQECYANPADAFHTNVLGTVNLMDALRMHKCVRSIVVVTTDKVYENRGDGACYREEDRLGGDDPYAASKTCMEHVSRAYLRSYFMPEGHGTGVATVRASNVLGGGDHVPSRLVPSILRAIHEQKPIELRNPHQTRPWQSVLDALNGYLTIGRKLCENPGTYSDCWNIGPAPDGIREVEWVGRRMQMHFHSRIELRTASEAAGVRESETLGLDITKSLSQLGWYPEMPCDEMLSQVVAFYKGQLSGIGERELCCGQVRAFFGMTPHSDKE